MSLPTEVISVSRAAIEAQWLRLLALAVEQRPECGRWRLAWPVQPDGARQLPWLLRDGDTTVMVLGYTGREAYTALVCMCEVLTAVGGSVYGCKRQGVKR